MTGWLDGWMDENGSYAFFGAERLASGSLKRINDRKRHELLSKLLVSPLIAPIVPHDMIPHISPLRSSDCGSHTNPCWGL